MDFLEFIKHLKMKDGKPFKLSPVQKRIWEYLEQSKNGQQKVSKKAIIDEEK